MAQIDIRRTYADGVILLASDLDAIVDDVESFLNTTRINDDNLLDNSITASSKLLDASINSLKLGTSSVTTAKINDLAVTTAKINDLAVTTAKINDLAVTEGKIGALAVTEGKIGALAVTEGKIGALAVTEGKIGALAVTGAKMAASTISVDKLLMSNWNLTSFSGASTPSATVASQSCSLNNVSRYEIHVFGRTVVPGASVTLTLNVNGNPVASNTFDGGSGVTVPWSLYYAAAAVGTSATISITQSGGGTTACSVFVKDCL